MPYVRLYAKPSLPPPHARKPDHTAGKAGLDAFVANVRKAVSADRLPRPAAANSVVVDPGRKSFSTIGAALDSITDASEGRQYVVSIGAGTYNEVVTCKSWVFLSGAGPGQTLITALSQANSVVPATVTAASHSAVHDGDREGRRLAAGAEHRVLFVRPRDGEPVRRRGRPATLGLCRRRPVDPPRRELLRRGGGGPGVVVNN